MFGSNTRVAAIVRELDHALGDVAGRIAAAAVDEVDAADALGRQSVDLDLVAVDDDVVVLPEGSPGRRLHAALADRLSQGSVAGPGSRIVAARGFDL